MDPNETDVEAFENRLRETYKRDSDQDHVAHWVKEYKSTFERRIDDEKARPIEEIRAEERANISLNLILSLSVAVIFTIWAFVNSDQMLRISRNIKQYITINLGWFFVALSSASLIYLAWLAFSRFGDVVLGDPDVKPEFSNLAWYSMLFSAGMGVGILFWGGVEPIIHYLANPAGESATTEAARHAMALTMFHWGFHGWGVYTLCAVAVAFHGFRHRKSYLISSAVTGLVSKRWQRPLAIVADLTATLAIIFGLAASLGTGSLQLAAGLDSTFGLNMSTPNGYTIIIACLTVAFLFSASTGLEKGIRILSELNMFIAVILLGFVFVCGPSLFSIKLTVDTLGGYLTQLPSLSFKVAPFTKEYETWMADWTITYFSWWVAWAPFVGIFIARISRGRTIKELILGSTLVPVLMTVVWFSVFGGMAFSLVLGGDTGLASLISDQKYQDSLFYILNQMPLTQITSTLAVILIATFLITSADSACFVIAMMTSEGDLDPKAGLKVVWGVVMATITVFLARHGNLDPIQAVAQMSAIPFSIILVMMAVALPMKLAHHVEQKRI